MFGYVGNSSWIGNFPVNSSSLMLVEIIMLFVILHLFVSHHIEFNIFPYTTNALMLNVPNLDILSDCSCYTGVFLISMCTC